MNCRKVHFGMLRLQPFMYHYSSRSKLSHRIESLYYEETMKRKNRGNSLGPGCGLRNPRSRFGRVGSVKLGDDLRGMTYIVQSLISKKSLRLCLHNQTIG